MIVHAPRCLYSLWYVLTLHFTDSIILKIDPKGALVELDFYLDFYWTDDRFDMPLYWEKGSE